MGAENDNGVMDAEIVASMRRRDTPLNGGWGIDLLELAADPGETAESPGSDGTITPQDDSETARTAAVEATKRDMLARMAVPEGCEVDFIPTLPYAGGEPLVTPVIRHPIDPAYAALPA
jgi:hypothetical protein